MALLEFFTSRRNKAATASVAKERLQIIVAEHRRAGSGEPTYLPQLKRDILAVIQKYVEVSADQVTVSLDQREDDLAVLELNVMLPEDEVKQEVK